jgi:hypothetical protein
MKAILEFDLNDQDDNMAHLRAVKSLSMAMALWNILYNSKKTMMHQVERAIENDKNITPIDAVEMTYDAIWDIVKEEGIIIDELIN